MELTDNKMMEKKFLLKGLSKPKSMTFHTENEELFWVNSTLSEDKFNELFNVFTKWKEDKFAILSYDRLREDGTPINPKFIRITI